MRPIVAGINSANERLCEWVDLSLQPLVRRCLGYLQDTKHVLSTVQNIKWEPTFSWLTCDIESLYSVIPHKLAIKAVIFHLEKYSNYDYNTKLFLLDAIEYLLANNYFVFHNNFFMQRTGASMGAKFSPSLANLYVSWFEEVYVFTEHNPYSQNIVWYGRYIDDIIIIWGGNMAAIPDYVSYLNHNAFGLIFTYAYHASNMSFLDIELYIEQNYIQSKTFRKTTACNSILHAGSCHPFHTKKSIPVGELLRSKRNCSTELQYQKEKDDICNRLKQRGYSNEILDRATEIADTRDRQTLLKYEHKKTMTNKNDKKLSYNKPMFITTYSTEFTKIRQIINKYIPILKQDTNLHHVLMDGVKSVTRKAPTLQTMLSPSLISIPNKKKGSWLNLKGFFKCGLSRCSCCKYVKQTKEIFNLIDGSTYNIKDFLNCESKNMIYCIQCTQCDIKYIGCTARRIKDRIREHIYGATHEMAPNISNASKHFRNTHAGDVSTLEIFGIERVNIPIRGGDKRRALLNREGFWILMMNSSHPRGMNHRLDLILNY